MLNVISYGGGVQSTALLVMAAQKHIAYKTFLFCNVGEDSEHPKTLAYVHDIAMPYANAHGIELIELHKTRLGEPETLYQRLMRPDRSVGIPVRMSNGAPGRRACTKDFKIMVVAKWLREHGATAKTPATVGMGISLDEFQRMRNDSGLDYEHLDYPLIDQRFTRDMCIELIGQAGLPIPPKSSCWFCPFHTIRKWQEMREQEPDLFWKAAELEVYLNEKRQNILHKDKVWLSSKLIPLVQATTFYQQGTLFHDKEDACDSGYCMT